MRHISARSEQTQSTIETLYWVFAPCGLAVGYKMTREQAEKTVERHSLYPGEPHWQIVPVGADIPSILREIDARLEAESRERLAQAEART